MVGEIFLFVAQTFEQLGIELPTGVVVSLPSNKRVVADIISGEGMGADSIVVSSTTVLSSFEVRAGTFELSSDKELGAEIFNLATTLLLRNLGVVADIIDNSGTRCAGNSIFLLDRRARALINWSRGV